MERLCVELRTRLSYTVNLVMRVSYKKVISMRGSCMKVIVTRVNISGLVGGLPYHTRGLP